MNELQEYIEELKERFRGVVCGGYVFGSALESKDPEDVDILLVYRDDADRRSISTQVRCVENEFCKRFSGMKLDVVVLSVRELAETRFLERINRNWRFL